MASAKQQKHFVLIHGGCHGAWSWYKLKPLLELAGHQVTALDMSASGINLKKLEELRTLADYTQPLLEFMATVSATEKVILVGHSFGGLSLALATDEFPEKVSVGIFVAAFMPDYNHVPSYVLEQYNVRTPAEEWLDTQFLPYGTIDDPLTSMFFGPEFLSLKLYHLCSREDIQLGIMLKRPGSLFLEDLSKASKFSKEGYGSTKQVYVVFKEDKGIPKEFQQWMIKNHPVTEVREIEGADHMAMLSKPQELCTCLLDIAQKYP